jgi:hypothetical protein
VMDHVGGLARWTADERSDVRYGPIGNARILALPLRSSSSSENQCAITREWMA